MNHVQQLLWKKELARQVFVRYWSKCSYLAQMLQHFLKLIFVRVFKKKGIVGTFKYLASTFYLFVEKRVFVRYLLLTIL